MCAPLLLPGLAHLCTCLQGQLYRVAQARLRAHSPQMLHLVRDWVRFPTCYSGVGSGEEGIFSSPVPPHGIQSSHLPQPAPHFFRNASVYRTFCFSLSYQTTHLLTIVVPICLALQGAKWALVFSLEPRADHTRPVCGSLCPTQSVMALGRTMLSYQKEIITVPNGWQGSVAEIPSWAGAGKSGLCLVEFPTPSPWLGASVLLEFPDSIALESLRTSLEVSQKDLISCCVL